MSSPENHSMTAMDVHSIHVAGENRLAAETAICTRLEKRQLARHLVVWDEPSSPINLPEFILSVMYHTVREVFDLLCEYLSKATLRRPECIIAGSVLIQVSVHAFDRI
jgi:hypothetical protein